MDPWLKKVLYHSQRAAQYGQEAAYYATQPGAEAKQQARHAAQRAREEGEAARRAGAEAKRAAPRVNIFIYNPPCPVHGEHNSGHTPHPHFAPHSHSSGDPNFPFHYPQFNFGPAPHFPRRRHHGEHSHGARPHGASEDEQRRADDAERLRQEQEARRQAEALKKKEEAEKAAEERRRSDEARRNREKQEAIIKVQKAWASYESRWAALPNRSPEPAWTFASIPWPTVRVQTNCLELTPSAIQNFLLASCHSQGKTRKDRVRAALLRWHPDKFIGRYLHYVRESDRAIVSEGVNIVCNVLHRLQAAA